MLLNEIDDGVDLDGDMAYELTKDMWLDIFQMNMDSADSIVTFVQCLELIQENAKGFVFELGIDVKCNIHSVVCQTATMRDNFERFGEYISLDTIKRAINKWLWIYMSVVMYNELKKMYI